MHASIHWRGGWLVIAQRRLEMAVPPPRRRRRLCVYNMSARLSFLPSPPALPLSARASLPHSISMILAAA